MKKGLHSGEDRPIALGPGTKRPFELSVELAELLVGRPHLVDEPALGGDALADPVTEPYARCGERAQLGHDPLELRRGPR